MKRINAFGAWKLPSLLPELLDATAMAVLFLEKVAEDPVSVWHD
ncbi:Pigment biosynthesis protein Ayg1 [Pyrenophora tritici-repentis]|nr:Pigment biosynthesis protein Ayg1 [Pyrenophora tritici-repentis]